MCSVMLSKGLHSVICQIKTKDFSALVRSKLVIPLRCKRQRHGKDLRLSKSKKLKLEINSLSSESKKLKLKINLLS